MRQHIPNIYASLVHKFWVKCPIFCKGMKLLSQSGVLPANLGKEGRHMQKQTWEKIRGQ